MNNGDGYHNDTWYYEPLTDIQHLDINIKYYLYMILLRNLVVYDDTAITTNTGILTIKP